MRRILAATLVAVLAMGATAAGAASPRGHAGEAPLQRRDVSFAVANPHEPGRVRTVHGFRIDPACAATTVVLLQHGLSYTGAAWDFTPDYSVARTLARAGYAVVAIDRLGYGRSVLEDGRAVSVEAYASMAHQIAGQLRAEFAHVAVGGHSAGAEATETMAGVFGGADAILALGYHHFPSPELVLEFASGDAVRAAQDDYEYFLATPEQRAAWFYTEAADPEVVAADTAAAVLTPSGEIHSIGKQPSRSVAANISVPVFLQLADADRLFPVEYADEAAAMFVRSPAVTVDVVPDAGHTFMLHPSGTAAAGRMAAWLASLPQTPPCRP